MFVHGNYFYGNEISDYGKENGYVDYRTFAKAFDAVMSNDIISTTDRLGVYDWEQISGYIDNSNEIDELQEQIDELQEQIDSETGNPDEMQQKIDELQEQIDELEEEQGHQSEIFQWFIIDSAGAEICQEANEIVFYSDTLEMYVWGVTHWGTSWDYVLTDIRCNVPYDEEA